MLRTPDIMTKTPSRRSRRATPSDKKSLLSSPWVWMGLGAVLIAITLLVVALTGAPDAAAEDANGGAAAAAGSSAFLASLDSALASNAEGYTLVNFWATWCPPCRAELPDLVAYYEDHAADGFMLIGVNQGESAAQVTSFLDQNALSFPIVLDTDGRQGAPYGITGLPSSYLINPAGEIVQQWTGMISRSTLENTVTPLLAQ
jgi:thiol-disulfide isomerase/thioredoxin